MKFRKDINGLRSIAVIAVVLFHFNPHWVPGGFAGVDVFFVISGFLMTGIIFRGLENNNFSIINFYVARANRIIPALSVLCLVLMVFGWFYLIPYDYKMLGKHIASSVGFISNIIYWREAGYFDAASHSKWLLHTWSLSVEWQFYILYPIVLVLLKKCLSLTNIKRLLFFGTVLGFAFSAYATYRMFNASYFLLPTRAWEMMMGGLAFLYPFNIKHSIKKYLEWLGIALILTSYAFISSDNLWPGYLAIIPVFGAYLVLVANREGSAITDNIVAQKVGLWSYSIYLWHWPVVVFGYYFEMKHWPWVGIPLSLLLGFLSYKFVESIKFPKLSSISFKPIVTFKPLWMVVVIGITSIFVLIDDGLISIKYNQHDQEYVRKIVNATNDWGYPPATSFFYGAALREVKGIQNDGTDLFIGDSLIEQYYPKIKELSDAGKYRSSIFFTEGGCLPIYGITRGDSNKMCKSLYKISDYINNKKFKNVFVGGYYVGYFAHDSNLVLKSENLKLNNKKDQIIFVEKYLKPLFDKLKRHSENVYFILPTPMGDEFAYSDLIKNIKNFDYVNEYHYSDFYRKKYKFIYEMAEMLDVETIDPINYLCKDEKCYFVDKSGKPFYKDNIHMRPWYVKKYVSFFDDIT